MKSGNEKRIDHLVNDDEVFKWKIEKNGIEINELKEENKELNSKIEKLNGEIETLKKVQSNFTVRNLMIRNMNIMFTQFFITLLLISSLCQL